MAVKKKKVKKAEIAEYVENVLPEQGADCVSIRPYLDTLPKRWNGCDKSKAAQARIRKMRKLKNTPPEYESHAYSPNDDIQYFVSKKSKITEESKIVNFTWVNNLPAYILANGHWCLETQIIHYFERT